MLKGFRDFLLRGNVVELAVAVVAGAAFNAIVSSLVKDVLMQILALIVGKPDFGRIVLTLHGTPIYIGNFLNAVVSFTIVAAALYFLIILPLKKLEERVKKPQAAAVVTKDCPECLSAIPLAARRCAHCGQPVAV